MMWFVERLFEGVRGNLAPTTLRFGGILNPNNIQGQLRSVLRCLFQAQIASFYPSWFLVVALVVVPFVPLLLRLTL